MSDSGYEDDDTDTSVDDTTTDALARKRAMAFMIKKAMQGGVAPNPALAVQPAAPALGAAPINAPAPRPAMPQGLSAARAPSIDTGADDYYNYLDKMEAARAKQVQEAYAPQIKYWEDARKRLQEQRSGPSASERLAQLSAAFFAPTPYRGFSATMGNIMPVLAEQEKAKREDAERRAALLDKYQQGALETGTAKALALLPKDRSAAMLAYMTKMGKAGKGPGIVVDQLRGVARRKDTGAEIMTADPDDVKDLLFYINQGRGAEATLKFDKAYGPGAAELYITAAQEVENGGY